MGFEPKAFSAGDDVRWTIEVAAERNIAPKVIVEVCREVDGEKSQTMMAPLEELNIVGLSLLDAYLEHEGFTRMDVSPRDLRGGDILVGLGAILGDPLRVSELTGDSILVMVENGMHVMFHEIDPRGKFPQQVTISRPIKPRRR